jgi:predicted RNA-binding Zn ribbon-like protein
VNFGSYKDDAVLVASSIVNHLTPGIDGTRPYDVPADHRARRTRARQISALDGESLPGPTLDAFVDLAAKLRAVFEMCGLGDVSAAALQTNQLLAEYRSAPVLLRHDDGPWHVHFHSAHAGLAEGWAAGCATGLALVIGAGESDRLGVCTADPCDRVFVDVSRNGTRRHCSPRCTNRAGVAAHRARARADQPSGVTGPARAR